MLPSSVKSIGLWTPSTRSTGKPQRSFSNQGETVFLKQPGKGHSTYQGTKIGVTPEFSLQKSVSRKIVEIHFRLVERKPPVQNSKSGKNKISQKRPREEAAFAPRSGGLCQQQNCSPGPSDARGDTRSEHGLQRNGAGPGL